MAGKQKAMTAAEKKRREKIRAELREKGVLPEKKKPLNREVFIKDAKIDFGRTINLMDDMYYVLQAIYEMAGSAIHPTLENIGAAKAMKMACEIKRFEAEIKAAGRDSYTVGEYVARLEPIYKA